MHDIFYFTDVHGQLDLFQTMRDWCYAQDPECMIVYGGDACDRGEFGMDIMEAILDDPQIVYIRGNHEDMFIKAARELAANNPEIKNRRLTIQEANDLIDRESWLHWMYLSLRNGGRPTIKAWLLDGTSMDFIDRLEKRTCLTFELDNGVCFSHAGGTYEAWQRARDCEYENDFVDKDDAEEMIWDRSMLNACWPENKIIVFGHTPTCYLSDSTPAEFQHEREMRPVAYRSTYKDGDTSGWHIGMDTGMTFYGRGYVLNCLTMNVTGFYDQDVRLQDSKRAVEIGFENFKII